MNPYIISELYICVETRIRILLRLSSILYRNVEFWAPHILSKFSTTPFLSYTHMYTYICITEPLGTRVK